METQTSIKPVFLSQTAYLAAQDAAAARINGSIVVTGLTDSGSGNVGSVFYRVYREQASEITQVELLDKDGEVLTASAVYLPVLEDVVVLRHTFAVKEGV